MKLPRSLNNGSILLFGTKIYEIQPCVWLYDIDIFSHKNCGIPTVTILLTSSLSLLPREKKVRSFIEHLIYVNCLHPHKNHVR